MMKSVSEIAADYSVNGAAGRSAGYVARQPQTKKITHISQHAAQVVNDVFAELQVVFPAWQFAFPTPATLTQAKKSWSKAFIEQGIITKAQLDMGFVKARQWGKPFLPSIGQFCDWCKPTLADFGLPEPDKAFAEASNKVRFAKDLTWSDPAVYLAAIDVGSWSFSNLKASEVFKLFERSYAITTKRAMNGEDLTAEIPKALPAKVHVPTSQSQSQRNVAGLKVLLKRGSLCI